MRGQGEDLLKEDAVNMQLCTIAYGKLENITIGQIFNLVVEYVFGMYEVLGSLSEKKNNKNRIIGKNKGKGFGITKKRIWTKLIPLMHYHYIFVLQCEKSSRMSPNVM